jgi:hypothetical protein
VVADQNRKEAVFSFHICNPSTTISSLLPSHGSPRQRDRTAQGYFYCSYYQHCWNLILRRRLSDSQAAQKTQKVIHSSSMSFEYQSSSLSPLIYLPCHRFGILVRDDRCNNVCKHSSCYVGSVYHPGVAILTSIPSTVEALVGTLKAAKKRKVIAYNSELLLQGPHDNVDIVLLQVFATVTSDPSEADVYNSSRNLKSRRL